MPAPRLRPSLAAAALAAASATTGLLAAGGPHLASADPASATARVGVGSDTTQDLFNAYSGADPYQGSGSGAALSGRFYTPLTGGPSTNKTVDAIGLSSFDAIPAGGSASSPGAITTRYGGPAFDRPNGTNAGITALRASIGQGTNAAGPTYWIASTASATGQPVNVSGQIDFARSVRGPSSAGTTLTFIPFARDGITYAYLVASGDSNLSAIAALTSSQLIAIYSSSSATTTVGTDRVEGCLPQAGAGVRTSWETAIGVTDAVAGTEATAAGCNTLEQNGGNSFAAYASAQESANPGTAFIIPFSVGSWISQANGVADDASASGRAAGLALGDPDGLAGGPTTGSAPNLAPNGTYEASSQYGRDLFVVVPTNKISGLSADRALQGLFGGASSAICSAASLNEVTHFGFSQLTSADGVTNTSGTTVFPACGDTTSLQGSN